VTVTSGRAARLVALTFAVAACGGTSNRPTAPLVDPTPTGPVSLDKLRGALVSIDIAGLPADRAAAARSVLRSEVGGQFERTTVAADVRAIWGLGSVADVRVEGRLVQGGVGLRYTVREQSRIRSIDVRGSNAVPAAQWLAQMPIKAGDFYDPVRVAAIRRTIVEQLRKLGFHTVKVAWSAPDAKGAGVDLVFSVEEGKLVGVAAIELRGNKALSRKAALAMLTQGGTAVGQRYWRESLQAGIDAINQHYFDLGYVNAAVGPVEEKLAADGAAMTLIIPISEGDQFRLGELAFEGTLAAPEREYASRFGMRRGQVFSRRKIAEGMDRLREFHRGKQPGSDLVPLTEVDPGKKRIKVTIQVVAARGAPRPPAPGTAPAAPAGSAPPTGAGQAAPTSPAPSAAPANPAANPAAPANPPANPTAPANPGRP
jgi:outer membrane protein insertion porin family